MAMPCVDGSTDWATRTYTGAQNSISFPFNQAFRKSTNERIKQNQRQRTKKTNKLSCSFPCFTTGMCLFGNRTTTNKMFGILFVEQQCFNCFFVSLKNQIKNWKLIENFDAQPQSTIDCWCLFTFWTAEPALTAAATIDVETIDYSKLSLQSRVQTNREKKLTDSSLFYIK